MAIFVIIRSTDSGNIPTFIEADQTGDITVTPDCIAFDNIETRTRSSYVYKTHTTEGDFTYEFDAVITSSDLYSGETVVWGVTNTADITFDEWQDGIIVSFYKGGSIFRLELENVANGKGDSDLFIDKILLTA